MKRGAAITFFAKTAGVGLRFVMLILLAQWMGSAHEFGVYAMAQSIAQLLCIAAGLGLPTAVVRFVAAYRAEGDEARLRGLLRRSRQCVLLAGLGLAAATALVFFLIHRLVHPLPEGIVLSLPLLVMFALMELQRESLRGFEAPGASYVPPMVLQPALAIAAAFTLWRLTGKLTAVDALLALLASTGAIIGMQWVLLTIHRPKAASHTEPTFETRQWISVALPLMLVYGFMTALGRSDIMMLGMLRSSAEAGIYTAATRSAIFVLLVVDSINVIAAPRISALHSSGDREALQRLVRQVIRYAMIPTAAMFACLLALGPWLLSLLGQGFTAGYWPMIILACGHLLLASFGPVVWLLSMTGHQKDMARISGGCVALNIVLNLMLITLLGMIGAAVATTIANATQVLLMRRCVHRRLGVRLSPWRGPASASASISEATATPVH